MLVVALLAEGVDRNNFCLMAEITEPTVALLAEGVDRNTHESALRWADVVALLAEGVDRNFYITQITNADWTVALLAEGVDRNISTFNIKFNRHMSPSSRRAWIEIITRMWLHPRVTGRPPRGGRG